MKEEYKYIIKNNGWVTTPKPLVGSMTDSKTTTNLDLQVTSKVEVQRENNGVG
jgi:hypothetical protein